MKIKEGWEIQNVGGEYIIVPAGADNVDYSKIISLNETAAYLWENVATKESFCIEDITSEPCKYSQYHSDDCRGSCSKAVHAIREVDSV